MHVAATCCSYAKRIARIPACASAMTRRPLRAGPWPGLTPLGGIVLLGCAALMAVGRAPFGEPSQPLPDLVTLALVTFAPVMLAARVVHMPGAAAAACCAYLLPRTLISLIDPSTEPPPLLLVPAVAFEVAAWLRPSDVRAVTRVWPWPTWSWRWRDRPPRQAGPSRAASPGQAGSSRAASPWQAGSSRAASPGQAGPSRAASPGQAGSSRAASPGQAGPWRAPSRDRRPRQITWRRGLVGGAVYGVTLSMIEPPLAVLLGGNASAWSGADLWLASGLATVACAALGGGLGMRSTAS
jgi:hypothetical protein